MRKSLTIGVVCTFLAGMAAAETKVGICEHIAQWNVPGGGALEIKNGVFRICRSAGIDYVRSDFLWSTCEPTEGQWDWSAFDAVIQAAEAEGITILPILDYNSAYSGKKVHEELDNWTEYVRQVVTRYKRHFKAVQVWNEENSGPFWNDAPNVQEYIPLLKVTYETVKAIDPNIQVVMGGLAGRRSDYFKTLCTDAKAYFDIVAFHPYNSKHEPSWTDGNSTPGSNGMIDEYLKVMSDTGVSKPVWITEVGYATHKSGVSEANQAQYLKEVIAHCESKGIDRVFIYEFRAPEWQDQPDNAEGYFGIVHADLTPKPAFETIAKMLKGDGWTNPYAGYVFLAAGDEAWYSSVDSPGHWSNQQVPSSANHYLVDIGRANPMLTPLGALDTFGGASLTFGRVGGNAGALLVRSPVLNVADLRLANGDISFAGGNDAANRRVLNGTATVISTADEPFSVVSEESGAYARWSGTVKGAAGTAVRFATEAPGASLDVLCDFDGTAYFGTFVVDGPGVVVRFTSSAIRDSDAFKNGGIVLRNGAKLFVDGVFCDPETGRTTFGVDTFEECPIGTEASALDGWTGEGVVVSGTPTLGNPPGCPVAEATHAKVLSLEDALRTYANARKSDNQTVELICCVERPVRDLFEQPELDGTEQFAVTVDRDGFLRLLHADAEGRMVWTRLEGLGPHADGEWLRISLTVDYTSVPGAAFIQVRENGSCCIAADGQRTPLDARVPGSWFRMPDAAATARCISSLRLQGEGNIDDLVLGGFPADAGPGFKFGSVTEVGGIPLSWFDGYGIPQDPNADPDGDGFSNASEWQKSTNPLDRHSHPHKGPMIMFW